ncbi:hypothetical protein DPX16_17171 [Anabarilius grahami]|uniref:Uncharacterized protein n=1 Tax=Anabarilius grahami TaxID=495550 RepID=A0A3N0YC09_ANAGA|nr:hypothetical protein DPX16_17171 [Anabarilius grahami]
MHEPDKRTEYTIVPEPEPHRESDQVQELGILCIPVGVLLEYKTMEWSPAHTTDDEALPWLPEPSVSCGPINSPSPLGSPPPSAPAPTVAPLVIPANSPPWLLPPLISLWAFLGWLLLLLAPLTIIAALVSPSVISFGVLPFACYTSSSRAPLDLLRRRDVPSGRGD